MNPMLEPVLALVLVLEPLQVQVQVLAWVLELAMRQQIVVRLVW